MVQTTYLFIYDIPPNTLCIHDPYQDLQFASLYPVYLIQIA